MKAITIDLTVCNGCYACQIGCKDEHVANNWPGYAKPQPNVGHFWLKIDEKVRGSTPKVKIAYRPHICMHCGTCIEICPQKAIYRREDGLVIIDPDKCTGCMNCVSKCPYEAIYYNKDLLVAQKCTGCAHLLDDGWKQPHCAVNCPNEAIKVVEVDSLDGLKNDPQYEAVKPELGLPVRVFYKGILHRFVAGTVYDPVEKEVLIGAKLSLKNKATGEARELETDWAGDFWFHDVCDNADYALTIAHGGKTKQIDGISTADDVNLGDIAF
ncbi:MAG: 4Fe-4S binding protein [Clostridiales Family XIII bacterium]|jgi:Fe-S-cluster-containing dehydrogenase component|nr:4Fe-4S binding protein [Clostridiales Family XIII bacterium]